MNFVEFLCGRAPDFKGRWVSEYATWDNDKWEECHDHMQWAFPTRTASAYNPNAPLVPADYQFVLDTYHPALDAIGVQSTILILLRHYLASVGVAFSDTIDIKTGYYKLFWAEKNATYCDFNDWSIDGNHNLLRMTRVLECLGIFGLDHAKEELYNFLVYTVAADKTNMLSAKTVAFWSAARDNKLHLLRG